MGYYSNDKSIEKHALLKNNGEIKIINFKKEKKNKNN